MGGLISCMIFLEHLFFCGFLGFSDHMRVICYFPLSGFIFHASCVVRQCLFLYISWIPVHWSKFGLIDNVLQENIVTKDDGVLMDKRIFFSVFHTEDS